MKKYNINVTACVHELNTFNSMPSFEVIKKSFIIEAKDKEDAKQKGREMFIADTLYKGSVYGEYTGERRVAPFMEGFSDDHPDKYEDITRRDYFEYRWQINVFVKQYRKPRTQTTEATAQPTEATAETAEATAETAQTTETTEATTQPTETKTTEETTEATTQPTETTQPKAEETTKRQPDTAERGSTMKNYEVKAIIETGAECLDIIPDDSEIMADSVEEAIDCVISDLMEEATYSDYNAERYDNYKLVISDHNNIVCVYRFKARLTFDNKEIEGAEWEEPEYCDTVTETTEEAKKDILKKYEAEGLTEAGQWVPLFNDLIDNAETAEEALYIARGRMLKKGLDVSVRVRAYYYNRITGEGCYSHIWTEQPKAEETEQPKAEETEQTTETETTTQPTEETAQTTGETAQTTGETAETTEETTEATTQTTETQHTEETGQPAEVTTTGATPPPTETGETAQTTETKPTETTAYQFYKEMLNSCYGMCVTAQTTEETAQTTGATTHPTETETTTQPTETETTTQPTETETTTQPTETETTAETTEATTHYRTGRGILSEAFHRATKSTPPPPIISTRKGVNGVTIREHRQYNNGIEKVIVHKGFYNFDELIAWYQSNDPSFLCTYKGILFGCDDVDYYASSFIYESEYL